MRHRPALILLAVVIAAGCSRRGPGAALDSYNERLARVLVQDMPQPRQGVMPRLPRVHKLRRVFAAESINLLQFLEIRDCELGHLVAEHNSVLGRVAVASRRLVYDIDFLRTGNACIKLIGADHPKLSAMIKAEMEEKKHRLPAVIWQATLGGSEFRKFWRFGGEPLPERFAPDEAELLAIRRLRKYAAAWLAGDYRVDVDDLEHQLDVIRHGDAGLQLRAWETLSNKLDIASGILASREAERPLCYSGMHPPSADVFGNVVQEMFIHRIQPWIARLNRRYYALFPAVRDLESVLVTGEPPAYSAWRRARDKALDHATHAILRHVNQLKPLLAQCSLMRQVK